MHIYTIVIFFDHNTHTVLMLLLSAFAANTSDAVILDRIITTMYNGSKYIYTFNLNNIKTWSDDKNEYSLTILANYTRYIIEICSCTQCEKQMGQEYNQFFDILYDMSLSECYDKTLNITFITSTNVTLLTHISVAIWMPTFQSSITEVRLESPATVMFIYTDFPECTLFSSSQIHMKVYATQEEYDKNQQVLTDTLIIKDKQYHPVYVELDPKDEPQTVLLALDIPTLNLTTQSASVIQIFQFQQALTQITVNSQNKTGGVTIFFHQYDPFINHLSGVNDENIYYTNGLRKYNGQKIYVKIVYLNSASTKSGILQEHYINNTSTKRHISPFLYSQKNIVMPDDFINTRFNTNNNEQYRQFQKALKYLLLKKQEHQSNSESHINSNNIQQNIDQPDLIQSGFSLNTKASAAIQDQLPSGILDKIFKKGWIFVSVQDNINLVTLNEQMQGSEYYLVQASRWTSNTFINANQSASPLDNNKIYIDNILVDDDAQCLIQSNNKYYLSLSLDNGFLVNGKISFSEHYYVKLPVNYILNSIIQIKPQKHYDILVASVLHKLTVGQSKQFTIKSNTDYTFYVSLIGYQNQLLFININKSQLFSLEILVGEHIIRRGLDSSHPFTNCTTTNCNINYFIKQYESNNLYIYLRAKSDVSIYGNITIQVSDTHLVLIHLTTKQNVTLSPNVQYQGLYIQNLPYLKVNNSINYAQYCLIDYAHKHEYCLQQDKQLIVDIQSSQNTIQLTTRCINQSMTFNVTVAPYLVWEFPNTSIIQGPAQPYMNMWVSISYRLNYIYYLKTNNTDSFSYVLSNKPCNFASSLLNCNKIEWDQFNMTQLKQYNMLSIIHITPNQSSKFQIEILKIRVMQVNINYAFVQREGNYLTYQFNQDKSEICETEPSVIISNMENGCVISSNELQQLINITSCSTKQQNIKVHSQNSAFALGQSNNSYQVYFKVLSPKAYVEIQNIKYCEYGELITISSCKAINIIQFQVPENNTQQVLVATDIDIIYNIINRDTNQSVEILGTFYSHTFLAASHTYDIYFYCDEKQLKQQEIKFYISSQNIAPINESTNITLKANNIYILTPKFNNILIKTNQTVTALISQNGATYQNLKINGSIIIKNSIQLYLKLEVDVDIELIQISNMYPNLADDFIIIDQSEKIIVLPTIMDFLRPQHNSNFNDCVVSYKLYVNYNLYYNGTNNKVEIINAIYTDENIKLNILLGNDIIYSIDKVLIVNSSNPIRYQFIKTERILQLVLDVWFYLILSLTFLQMLGVIAFIVILKCLQKDIIKEKQVVQSTKRQISISNTINTMNKT